ncbi:hypothetical protein ACJMK2_023215 [Sinanodonta woodiana]|uniref:Sugar transporter SWEET1 n=1 Tax=Sinanodonta woodiana TaxID=1069815 RepID=A0ABD3T3I6_SINWO
MEFVIVFGWIATASSYVIQIIGMQICFDIIKKGTTGDMTPFTFISYFCASSIWLKYGFLARINTLIASSFLSSIINLLFILVFYRYCSKRNTLHCYTFIGLLLLLLPLVYVQYYQTDIKLATKHLGLYAVLMSIVAYGAPLASLADVFRTKSTECISFPLVFANFVVAIEWFIYGGMLGDPFVQYPNLMGIVLGIVQLGMFVCYPSTNPSRAIIA